MFRWFRSIRKSHCLLRWRKVEHTAGSLPEKQPHDGPLLRLRERGSVRLVCGGDHLVALEEDQCGDGFSPPQNRTTIRSHLWKRFGWTLYAHGDPDRGLWQLPLRIAGISEISLFECRLLLSVSLLHVRSWSGQTGGVREASLAADR